MKSKKKLIISLSVALAVLLIAVVAIVSISAALNQNISSNIKVNFKPSQHVIGYVSAEYTYGDTTNEMTTNGMGNGNTEVMFNYNDKQTVKTLLMKQEDLQGGVLNLSSGSDIIIEFTFRNTGYSNFIVVLDLSKITAMENIKLSYSLTDNVWTEKIPEFEIKAPIYSDKISKSCSIKVEAKDSGLDAKFEGAFLWNLIAEEDQ